MTTSKTLEGSYIGFSKRNQIPINLREGEICDSTHHVPD